MKEKGWKELIIGGVITEPGNAREYLTGTWRLGKKPVWNSETCIQCLRCWISCPDSSFILKDEKITGIDYDHCKGCGICMVECPTKPKSIDMVLEEDTLNKTIRETKKCQR